MADMEQETIDNGDWIAKFLENSHLTIKDVAPDGDCFFHVVTEALASIGKNISVQKVRRLLSEQVTDDMFQQYLMLYKSTIDEVNKINMKSKKIKTKFDDYTKQFKLSTNKTEQMQLQELSLQTKEQYDDLRKEKQQQDILLQDFDFMKGVDTFDEFKKLCKNKHIMQMMPLFQ